MQRMEPLPSPVPCPCMHCSSSPSVPQQALKPPGHPSWPQTCLHLHCLTSCTMEALDPGTACPRKEEQLCSKQLAMAAQEPLLLEISN